MSVSSAASPPRSSLRKQNTRRFPSLISDRSRLKNSPFVNLPAFPSTERHYRRSLLYHSKPIFSRNSTRQRIGVFLSGEAVGEVRHREGQGELSFDAFLSAAEFICILPPSIFSIGCLLGLAIPGASKLFQCSLGNKFFPWQFFFMVSAVAIGGLIRRRQWRRICGENERASGIDLIERIEKVEQDMKSSATIVRVLSKHLEKLGIRFRVTKKALKEAIDEAAALTKKNCEVTRALAIKEDTLEKELVEIQKVLMAMQGEQFELDASFLFFVIFAIICSAAHAILAKKMKMLSHKILGQTFLRKDKEERRITLTKSPRTQAVETSSCSPCLENDLNVIDFDIIVMRKSPKWSLGF